MDQDLFMMAMECTNAYSDCDTSFTKAFNQFKVALTPSLNITTRNLWNLISHHLDEPLEAVIESEPSELAQKLLLGFKLSRIGDTQPINIFDADQWAAQKLVNPRSSITAERILKFKSTAKPKNLDIETIFSNMELWYQNIRFAIHCSHDCEYREMLEIIKQTDPTHPIVIESTRNSIALEDFFSPSASVKLPTSFIKRQQKSTEFCNALDTVIDLISTLKFFIPDRVLDTQATEPTLRNYRKIHASKDRHCELCWRLTIQSVECMVASETGTKFRIGLNNRYCYYHDPIEHSSQYKADLPYREIFQQELAALKKDDASNFEFQFPLEDFSKGYEMDVRKAAFDLAHAKLRPTKGKNKLKIGLKEQVFRLRKYRLNFEEIATALNTTKHSTKRAWESLESLYRTHQNEQFISSSTGEVIDQFSSDRHTATLFQINELLNQGASIQDIAKKTDFFSYGHL